MSFRILSNQIANISKVEHQSPQAILIHKNNVLYSESHGAINANEINELLKYRAMNSLKIILFIVLFVSFLGCNLSEDDNSDYLTLFTSEEDLTLLSGDKASIEIKINSNDVKKLHLLYNDSIIKTWNSPQKTNDSDSKPLRFVFDSKGQPLGSSVIRLQTEVSDEVDFLEDEKTITIWNKTAPDVKKAKVIASYPHDPSSYTQGLEFLMASFMKEQRLGQKVKVSYYRLI